jgi:gluconolactonase
MSVSVLAKNTCSSTGEGPYWEESSKSLVYVDILAGDVHRWNTVTGTDTKLHLGGAVTFIVPRFSGGYVIGRDQTFSFLDWDSAAVTSIAAVDQGVNTRMNDGKCDASGRLWAGTMGEESSPAVVEPQLGSLFSLDKNKVVRTQRTKVDLSNGLAWSHDNRTMFYIDSVPRKLYAFDFDLDAGTISNERTAIAFGADTLPTLGYPDGMSIDLDGKLWVACYSVGKVIRFDPETGAELQTVSLPASATTSCCWGGPNYDELFVTSGTRQLPGGSKAEPLAGSVFRVTGLGARGAAAPTFAG